MIDRSSLLSDLKKLLPRIENDIRDHLATDAGRGARDALARDYSDAKAQKRTAQTESVFIDEQVTQAAVAWILGGVFIRFIEDNELISSPAISGPGDRGPRAKDAQALYFQQHPTLSDREYLLEVYRSTARLPGMAALYDEATNPLFRIPVSGDGATLLIDSFRRVDPDTGALVHDFTDPELRTRFLGDLYQDLSDAARDKYALLQTPDFVLEFLLDRTLEPAIEEFGLKEATLIDPTCGSGHFLLGAFDRLLDRWRKSEPSTNVRELAQRALKQVAGVDINPFAVAIARFRLLVAALHACGIRRLVDAPDFKLNLAVGDSLLFGKRPRQGGGVQRDLFEDQFTHHYANEDADAVRRVLERTYSVVIGNPPYIVPRDAALNAAYRAKYPDGCKGKYSLVCPFIERFFDLAHHAIEANQRAGYVAMIAANSFMKREFGKGIIENYLRRYDLTCVVDTSGAYIPGHGTPTVLLFARGRWPVAKHVRAVQGIRGEPGTPEDPAHGKVWTEIVSKVEQPGFEGTFVSVADVDRERFNSHPWSMGGGGAADLREDLENYSASILSEHIVSIGFMAICGEDDLFTAEKHFWRRSGVTTRDYVDGECVRDWSIASDRAIAFPYDESVECTAADSVRPLLKALAPYRKVLERRLMFGKTQVESGLPWFVYRFIASERLRTPLSITFAEVATHNHFVLDRGGKVFKQTAPVIKLPADASEEEHLGLLGILNSSTACFWLRQVCTPKGGDSVGQEGARVTKTPWEERFAFNASNVGDLPLPSNRPTLRTKLIDDASRRLADHRPSKIVAMIVPARAALDVARSVAESEGQRMISEQEELDWECYCLYGLVDEDLFLPPGKAPPLKLGERPFEIVLARKLAAGEIETKWFDRHGSTPITVIPAHWPDEYKKLVARRIEVIASNANIRLIEQPEYKRRWNQESWEEQEQRALRSWLLDRLEDPKLWPRSEPRLRSTSQLADSVRGDEDFAQVAELYARRPDYDLTQLVTDLVSEEAVPYLPAFRYTAPGLRKRADWEKTWDLQRKEDAIDALGLSTEGAKAKKRAEVGDIAVPPKYASSDFQKATYWRHRGKLDVPKERFISYPHAESDIDPTPVVTWAGFNHLDQAKALAAWYLDRKESDGWSRERLQPLLLGLLDLLPWIDQWHPEIDPAIGQSMGTYFRGFVTEEARSLGFTLDDLRSWQPPETRRRRRAR